MDEDVSLNCKFYLKLNFHSTVHRVKGNIYVFCFLFLCKILFCFLPPDELIAERQQERDHLDYDYEEEIRSAEAKLMNQRQGIGDMSNNALD